MSEVIGSAFVRIRPDTAGFAAETSRSVKGALIKTAGVAGISVGIAEVIKQTKEAIAVERDRQIIAAQASTALRAAGQSWDEYGGHIDEVIQKQSKLSAFDDEDLLKSFTLLFRATKDVNSALDLNSIAANVARGRNLDLVRTAQLLVRVQAGQVGSLRRLGIQIDKNATGEQAIAAVRAQYARSAVTYAESERGAQARLNKVWNDTQELIGQQVSPALADYQRRLAEWLNKANESGETQRILNKYFGEGRDAVKGFADGVKIAQKVMAPFVTALGGIQNTAKLIVLAFAARKIIGFGIAIRGVATTFGFLAASSRTATGKIVADAATAERALDTAYRPRNVVITQEIITTGAGAAAGGAAAGAGASAAGGGAVGAARGIFGKINRIVRGPNGSTLVQRIDQYGRRTSVPLASVTAGAPLGLLGTLGGFAAFGVGSAGGGVEQRQPLALLEKNGQWYLDYGNKVIIKVSKEQAARYNHDAVYPPKPPKVGRGQGAVGAGVRAIPPIPSAVTVRGTGAIAQKKIEGRIAAFEESQTIAQINGDKSVQRRSLVAEREFINATIKAGHISVALRRQLRNSLLSIKSSIDGIDSQIAQDAQNAASKAAAARRAAQAAADKAFNLRVSTRVGGFERQRRAAARKDDEKGQLKALAAEETYLRKLISETKKGSARRERLQSLLASAQDKASAVRKKTAGTASGIDATYAQLERDRREAAARKDLAGQERALAAEEKYLVAAIAKAKAGSARKDRLQNELTTVHERQAKLKGTTSGGEGTNLFAEAVSNFLQFGSNITSGPRGILSGQQARGYLAGQFLLKQGVTTPESVAAAALGESRTQTKILADIARNTAWQGNHNHPWNIPDASTRPRKAAAPADPSRLVWGGQASKWGYGGGE